MKVKAASCLEIIQKLNSHQCYGPRFLVTSKNRMLQSDLKMILVLVWALTLFLAVASERIVARKLGPNLDHFLNSLLASKFTSNPFSWPRELWLSTESQVKLNLCEAQNEMYGEVGEPSD